ncbi:unnamed protein product, partial [marine sediment metagenome]
MVPTSPPQTRDHTPKLITAQLMATPMLISAEAM